MSIGHLLGDPILKYALRIIKVISGFGTFRNKIQKVLSVSARRDVIVAERPRLPAAALLAGGRYPEGGVFGDAADGWRSDFRTTPWVPSPFFLGILLSENLRKPRKAAVF